ISCTRTFGHTAIFVLGVTLFAWGLKSKATAALAIGIASHLVLDGFQDYWFLRLNGNEGESSALIAMLFPFYLPRFSAQPFPSALEHLKSLGRPFLLVSEAIGLLILARSIRDKRRRFKIAGRIGSTSKKSKAAR